MEINSEFISRRDGNNKFHSASDVTQRISKVQDERHLKEEGQACLSSTPAGEEDDENMARNKEDKDKNKKKRGKQRNEEDEDEDEDKGKKESLTSAVRDRRELLAWYSSQRAAEKEEEQGKVQDWE